MSNRRNALLGLGLLSGLAAGVRDFFALAPAQAAAPARAYEVTHTDAQWRTLLSGEQYHVLRQAGTERPFSSPLAKEKRAGVFNCAGCGLPLFSSSTKFNSGTGCRARWTNRSIRRSGCGAWRCCATAAAATSAMYSTMGPGPPGCAIA